MGGVDKSRSAGLTARLSRATLNYGLAHLLPQIVGFALIPLYTAYLTPKDFGILDVATSLTAFLVIVMRLGVPGAVTRFYYDFREGDQLKDYVTSICWFVMLASLVVGALTLAVSPIFLESWLPGLDYFPYVVLAVIGAVLSGNSDVQRRLIQAREQSAYSMKLTLAMASVTIVLAVTFVVFLSWGAWGMQLAYTLSSTLFFVQAIHYLKPDLVGRARWRMLRDSFIYAGAILPSHLIGNLSPLVVRGILAHHGTLSAVGILSTATRFAGPLSIIVSALAAAYNPVYFSVRKEGSPEGLVNLATTARQVLTTALLFAFAVAVLGPPAIRIMTPATYHEAAVLLPVFAVGFLANVAYAVFGAEIFYSKKTWIVPLVVAASAMTVVAVSALTVDRYGALGVAWAINAGALASALVATIAALRLVRIPHDWRGLRQPMALVGVAYILTRLSPLTNPFLQAAAGTGALVVLLAVLAWRRDPVVVAALSRLKRILRGS